MQGDALSEIGLEGIAENGKSRLLVTVTGWSVSTWLQWMGEMVSLTGRLKQGTP